MSVLLERAKGQVPPSICNNLQVYLNEDNFDAAMLGLMETNEFRFKSDAESFGTILEKCSSVDKIPEQAPIEIKQNAIAYRRSVILSAVGQTPTDAPSLECFLSEGLLTHVKSWLDEILAAPEGKLDFLLFMLSNIIHLPVTKSIVKESGMGKAVGTIEKHKLCKGTPNEAAIQKRVHEIKDKWNASVKARKAKDVPSSDTKRTVESSSSAPPAKKAKTESGSDKKSSSSFSSLLKKVSVKPKTSASSPKSKQSKKTASYISSLSSTDASTTNHTASSQPSKDENMSKKKTAKRVKWSDHFGGELGVAQDVESGDSPTADQKPAESASWSDRRKRDRIREKELLAKAKKSKLMDDDDDGVSSQNMMKPTVEWQAPTLLPDRSDVTNPQLESVELTTQANRIQKVVKAHYRSEFDVPVSPAPQSDVEQAHDMNSLSSAAVTMIPFFVSQQPVPVLNTIPVFPMQPSTQTLMPGSGLSPGQPQGVATLEFVQALGLPTFLVGQQVQALQTLASSPGLLRTMVDTNGMYDQVRLMSLVATLSSSTASQPQPSLSTFQSNYNGFGGSIPSYGQQGAVSTAIPSYLPYNTSDDGNLHVSGFGPLTTEADIISAFSPYVRIDEVVMKGTFAFVNTSDPLNAERAKQALSGILIGGMPIRINQATRKAKESAPLSIGNKLLGTSTSGPPSILLQVAGPSNVDNVRDDRGNPATKNLFVAGYGPSTTEQQLRDLFSQYAQVTGVVNKGSFAFINTSDKESAVLCRETLIGTMFNGGVLRINFAKETGRLGTSFDLTYNASSGPNARRHPVSATPANLSYYGRGN